MSQATKRKHVVKEVLGEYVVPSEGQQIVRVRTGAPSAGLASVQTLGGGGLAGLLWSFHRWEASLGGLKSNFPKALVAFCCGRSHLDLLP